jgi:hypothetical protein
MPSLQKLDPKTIATAIFSKLSGIAELSQFKWLAEAALAAAREEERRVYGAMIELAQTEVKENKQVYISIKTLLVEADWHRQVAMFLHDLGCEGRCDGKRACPKDSATIRSEVQHSAELGKR